MHSRGLQGPVALFLLDPSESFKAAIEKSGLGQEQGPGNCGKGQTMMCPAPKWDFLTWQEMGAVQGEEYNSRGCSSSGRAVGTAWKMSSVL